MTDGTNGNLSVPDFPAGRILKGAVTFAEQPAGSLPSLTRLTDYRITGLNLPELGALFLEICKVRASGNPQPSASHDSTDHRCVGKALRAENFQHLGRRV